MNLTDTPLDPTAQIVNIGFKTRTTRKSFIV